MAWYDNLQKKFSDKIESAVNPSITDFVKSAKSQSERDSRSRLVTSTLLPSLKNTISEEFENRISRADDYVEGGDSAAERAARIRSITPKAEAALDQLAHQIITLVRNNIEEKKKELSGDSQEISLTSDVYDDYVTKAVDYLIENGTDLSELDDLDFVIDFTSHIENILQAEGVSVGKSQTMASGILEAAVERYREELLAAQPPAAPATITQATPPPRPMVKSPVVTRPAPSKPPKPASPQTADEIEAEILAADFGTVVSGTKEISEDRRLVNVIKEKGATSREGNAAFTVIYTKYKPYITKFVRGQINKYTDFPELRGQIDDIVQTTFMKMLTSINGYTGDSSLPTWLTTITKNNLIDTVRTYTTTRRVRVSEDENIALESAESLGDIEDTNKTKKPKYKTVYGQRLGSVEAAEEDESSALASAATQRTALDDLLAEALKTKVEGILESLKSDPKKINQYNCFKLFHLPDPESGRTLTYQEIADKLGIPIGTVMSSIKRARDFVDREAKNDPEIEEIYTEVMRNKDRVGNPDESDIHTNDQFYDEHIAPILVEIFRREDAAYAQSPQSQTLRNRINNQIKKYDIQKRLIDEIRPKFRMPLEIGYATGYAKHLIFGTPEPKTTSLPKDRAAQVKSYVRAKFDELSY